MKKLIQFIVILLAVAGIAYQVLFAKKIEVKLYPSGNTESKIAKVGLVQEGVSTIFYDTNGNNKKSQTIFKSDVEHGTKKIWNTRGNKIKEIEFVDGVAGKERIWLYNTSGNKIESYGVINDKKEGISNKWHDTGVRKAILSFKNDQLNGDISRYNIAGTIIEKSVYDNGTRIKSTYWTFDDKGLKKSSTNTINDVKHGEATTWHPNGQKASVGNFLQRQKDGLHASWFSNGKLKSELNYSDGQLQGTAVRYNKSGKITEKSTYSNDIRTKATEWLFDEQGNRLGQTPTVANKNHGLSKTWFSNGDKKSESNYLDGSLDGETKTWHPNKIKSTTGRYIQGKKDGLHVSWFESGQKSTELNYKSDKLDGSITRYNPAGLVIEQSDYVNDLRLKAVIRTYSIISSVKLSETPIVNDKIHGVVDTWHPNKIKSTTGRYIQGKKDGLHVSWFESGQKSTELNYKSDKLDGSITRYNPAGLVIEQSDYSAGLRGIATEWTFNQQGNKLTQNPTVANKNHGITITWHANGTKASEGNYVAGDASGLHVSWYKSGQKSTELNYKSDKLDGSITRYNPAGLVIEQSDYSAGLRGIATEWTFDGQGNKSTQILFLGSNKQGLSTSWHANGEKSTEGIFENNIATGLFTYWDNKASKYKELVKKGSVDVRETYFKAGQKHGEQFTRYPSSAIKSIIEFRRGNEINRSVWFHEDGTYSRIKNFSKNLLVSDRYFDEGKPHGKTKFYYDNGKLDTEIDYTGGIKNGLSIAYSKSGKVIEEINFKDDSFHGTLTEFWPNGKKLHQTNFDMNTKHGKHESWYESGIKQSEMTYVDGIIDGKVKWYYRDGSLSQIGTFQDGGLLDNPIIYITNGDGTSSQLQSYLTLSAGKQYSAYVKGMTGILVTKANGFIKEVAHYVEGNKHGQFIDFHPNGAKKLEFTFKSPGTHYSHANGVIDLWHVNGLKRRTFAVVPDTGYIYPTAFRKRTKDNTPQHFGHLKDNLQNWNDDGELTTIDWYSAGKLLKEFSYYPIGNKSKEMIGTSTGTYDLRGIKDQYQSWYTNGTKARTLFISKPCTTDCRTVSHTNIRRSEFQRNGLTIFWDEAGFLDTVVNLKNNSNPTYTEYWRDGNKRIEASNKKYERRDYSPIMYHQRLKGKFTLWHKNGHKQYSATYKHIPPSGSPIGHNIYTKYNIPTKKISYLHGVAQWWDEAGNLVKEENWKNNKLTK